MVSSTILIPLIIVGILILIAFVNIIKNFTVVPPHEAHVISGRGYKIFDGQGRYVYWPLWQTRSILSKAVLEISVESIRLHDKQHLPFAVEISCKVQVGDARKAAETLGIATPAHIRPIVDDTIQSAARSQAMQHELVTIMKERDTIEESIYASTTDSLARLGVRVTLFDIKNIVDVEGSTVIADLERVRSSEINRIARQAEATQISQAEIVESQKKSESDVKRQEAFRDSEEARLKQEQFIADQRAELTLKEMKVLETETIRKAEIEKERVLITSEANAEKSRLEARGKADARIIEAEAEAEAIKMRANAEAEVIKARLLAEAEGNEKLAEALKVFNDAGISVKIAEIYTDAQKNISENIARGIQNNSKLFLPVSNDGGLGNTLTSLIPTISAMQEAGVSLKDLLSSNETSKKKTTKK